MATCEWIKLEYEKEQCSCCKTIVIKPNHDYPIKHQCINDEVNRKLTRRIKLKNFLKALFIHIKNGLPSCTQQEILSRYKICRKCGYFSGIACTHIDCGCSVTVQNEFLNKLSWADQECPIGKWSKIER